METGNHQRDLERGPKHDEGKELSEQLDTSRRAGGARSQPRSFLRHYRGFARGPPRPHRLL